MTIKDIYQKAIDRGVLSSEYTVEQFEKLLRNENLRRKYWEYADKNFSGFYSNDYNTFSKNTDNLLAISNTEDTNPSVSANPAPTTAQEDSINLAKQNEGEQQYNVVTPVVSSPTQTMDYNAITLDELQKVRNEQLRKAQASKERRVSEQKLWEQEHPFLASVAAMRGGGAYTDKSVGETLKDVDADQFAEDSKEQNAVKEALGRKLYESNYNNIGSEVEKMQSVVANISREDKKLGERKDLDKAEYVLDQAHRLATAPSKYDPSTNGLVNFGKGIADNTNRDLIPAVELIRDVNINNAIKKMNDGKELTEGERALILSYITYSDVQQARQYDLPMGYQAGAAAAESIPFMAEMLLTKGASKLAVSQVIRIMKAAGKTADQINDFAKWMNLGAKGIKVDDVVYGAVEEGAKNTLGDIARNTVSELVGTTLQTAAMPSTYQGMVEDNMRTRLATGENDIEGYNMNNLRNFGNAWVQTLTERKGGELIDWGLGKIMPFDKIWHTKAGNQMVANQFFQSPVAETMEEYLAAVINYGRSFNPLYSEESNAQLKQEAEDMFTAEGLGTTFLSMLPNTILGGAVNLYDVHKTSNDYNNARAKVLGELVKSGATQEQAENILMQIETSNEEEMREKFGILYSHFNIENAGGAGAKAAEEYIKAAQAYQFSVADLANKFANLTPEEQAQAQQEMQDFTSQVRQKAVEHEARMFAQTQAGEATNEDGNIYQVTRADGTTPEGSRMYISAGNVVTTDDGKGQQIIDRTQSSKDVFVTTYDADGNANVEHVALDELDLLFAPTSRQQVEDELYSMFVQEYAMAQQMAAQQAAQQATQAQGQQVVGEDNGQQPLGVAEGEQASNIEGRQFTNGQQTITASNPDSNGNVTLSAPVTLSNGVVTDQVMPQQVFDDLISGLIREEGWQEVTPQPAAQGQTQGQQQAPIVWSEMDANQATATVVERSKGDKERAKKFAQKQVEVKTKALQEAQAEMDAFEGDDLDAFNAVQDKVDAAQAEVDKWTAVANGIDAYVAPVQSSGNVSATSASGNGVVTEGTARQSASNPQQSANNSQNTLQNGNNSVPLQEKKRKRAQEIIDKTQGGNNTVYLFDMNDIIKVLEDAGVSQISIGNVKKQIAQMREGDLIGGFQIGNKIFINYDQDENEIRRKYIHERQHILTTAQLANKIASSMSWEELFEVVCNLCGSRAYQDRNAIDLAHELISFSMEWVYEYDNNQIVRGVLKNYGLNEEQILTLINLGNEQRKDNTLSRARRTAYVNNSRQGSGRQDGRDFSENPTRDMEGQGVRPSITSESRTERPSEVGQDTALEESGIQVNDETGDARFSVNYRLDANQIDILAEQIAERVGVSKAKAKKWLKSETSLAALCMQEDNVDALYYFADGRYGAIKNSSDYPQGTVDFNNICRKRLDFTNIYLSLQREFPNKIFTAKDLETIRQIMIEDGLEVACGLCYVEDRRQLLGEIANEFRGFLKDRVIPEDLSATKKEVMQKVLDMVGDDTYIPTIAQLLEAGAYELRNSHPSIFEAFVVFNNSRGMQSGRLFEGYAEYKREILDWSDKKVKQVNDAGGLRIFSFSDFEAHHLIDIVQIISDAASKGVMIQGYTKVPEFARAIRNTKVKLNRSLIPLGDTGIQEVDGKKVLAYDTTEGIDVNSENFLDESNNPNVGNVLVGINDEQIRMAMDDTNVDYIIPFHTGIKKDILLQKKIGAWVNYKNSQTEKDATTGSSKTADGKKVVGVNIYTDVLQAAENEGTPIKNRKEFVEYFLKVCKERGLVPRFEQFLARGKNGEYKYTKGYEKLLVDFKMFDKRGNILPQEPVVPIFDDAFNQQIIEDYVKGTKETKEYKSTKEKIKENLQLNDYTDDLAESESQVRYSIVTDKKKIEELEASEKMKGYRTVILNEDGTFSSPMATGLGNKGKTSAKTSGFELGKWEQAEERPELADENGKINLKPKKGGDTYVDYNPYIHNRLDKINTQFTSAWRKPFLVYIETEIPMSDIESGYHAEKAALPVGIHKWNGGDLVLSRYDKPVRIVPWNDVADAWAEQFDEVTFDIVNPELLPLLHERGVKILSPKKAAKEKALAAYEKWKAENSNPRFSVTAAEDKAYADAVARGDMATAQRMVIEAAKKAMPNTRIVDADGNPMIVYHDTNATELVNIETGENWNDLDWRAKDEWRKRDDFDEYWEERDFYTFNNKRSRRSIEMPAYFFSTKEDEYHEYGDRTIRAFLNITNPAIDPTIENAGTYDYAGEDAMNKLIEQGHDGFIRTTNNGEWDEVNAFYPNQIKSADPVTYDDNGNVIPLSERFNNDKSDIRFSLSNANQRIFVSNAERAVESIKQEKATPQQWKAMIEKQGGLKAGEDKWLGLSEWLDSKIAHAQEGETMGEAARRVAKNTITKQEILDYIAEHQIQIEEVEYAEGSPFEGDLTMEQEGNFNSFILELEEIITSEGVSEEEAFETMVDRYGDDFRMAFELDENNDLTYIVDYDGRLTDAAQYFLGKDNQNQINDVRLRYTTKGLENKQEIALTVPTIESWNEGDDVHFGDAGNGRAIAWIRFGETEVQTPREVIDHVDELQLAYTNANGQDVYAPQGSKFSKDYAVYGKLANGEMGYVLYVRNNQLSAHPTLEDALEALNAHYEANPRQVTEYGKVLVIDEIQSKRHQEGREKGYASKKDRDIKKKIAKLTDQQDAIFDAMRAREEGRAGIVNFTEEETTELKRLGEEIKQLQSELSVNNGIIPDAPFDKNWHELAFKRMLRYAAENGFDYVAWTTGAQQAERYDLGSVVDHVDAGISVDGQRMTDIYYRHSNNPTVFYHEEDGTITKVSGKNAEHFQNAKNISDIVGKELSIKILSQTDRGFNNIVSYQGLDLSVGGEGMKGFYDKMLPSFVSKYTKKWGAKVQDINLPSLEESAQTMHAVNVTQEMKDSVMGGQVMFSVRNTAEDLRMSEENGIFADQYRWGDTLLDEDYISEAYAKEMDAFYDALYTVENPLTEAERNKAMQAKARAIEEFLLKLNYNTPNLHVISSLENMQDELENAGVQQDVIDALIQEEKALREKNKMSWGMKLFDNVYIFAEPMQSLTEVQLTFAHEMQHIENERNKKLLADIVDVTSPQELNNILIAFGSTEYSKYLNQKEDGFIALADEVVAFMMEYGFALGKDGNLAEALKRDGLENTELINLLQQEYERRKEDTPFVLVKNQRGNKKHSNNTVGTSNDGSNLQGRSNKVARPKFGGFATGSMPQTRGELAKRRVEQQQLQKLRDDAVSKLLSTTEVDVPDINLDEETFYTPRFSVAPTPTPTETKGEYLKRYMAWRESQVNENAVNAYKEELKKGTKFWRTFVKKIVDRNIAIEKFQDFVLKISKSLDLEGKISINTNAFLDVSMAAGRAHSANERFKTRYQTPMMDAIKAIVKSKKLDHIDIRWNGIEGKKNGKKLTASELVGIYCQAKDVQEAIEMDLPDRGQQGFKDNLLMDGNEVSHKDIIRIVEDALAGTNLKDNLWKAVNQATLFSLIYQRRHRFISRKTFDEYKSRKFYVPERGWRERDLEDRERKYVDDKGNEGRMDSPFNTALKKAEGRSSLASDPFAYIVSIAKSTIAAVEKNRVKQKFLQFLFDNGQVGLKTKAWTIKQVYLVKVKNKDGEDIGTVATYEKPSNPDDIAGKVANDLESLKKLAKDQKNQHAVVVVKDGEEYVVFLEDEQLANALNRNYAGIKFQNSPFGRAMRGATGYYSGQLTQYNPEFAASNFVRDYILSQMSNFAVQDKPFEHFTRFNYNLVKIMPELVTYVGAHTIGREVFLNTKKGKYMQEYFALGAQTGFSYLEDVSVLRDLIDKVVNKNDIVKYATAVPKFMFIDMLSGLTELSELSIRMTQYITCREKGMSARAAAIEAKKITVDFDTRGELSSVFSGLWSFFNASVQGTNKIVRDIKRKPLRASLTYAGFAGLLFYLGYLLTNLFPDDPEEEEFWNEYVRRTNFTVGEYKIPMAHFFRIFWGGGVTMALKEQGRLTETQAAGEMTRMVFDEIIPQSPFQVQNLFEYNNDADSYDISLEGYERGLMPSVFMPIYDVKQNEDFLGRKISKEPYIKSEEGKYKAKKYERTESTNEKYIKIADWLSGGDPNVLTKGVDDGNPIDINGTELQYIVEGYTKQFATLIDTYNLVTKAIKEKEIQTKDIPFLRKFKKDYINESAYSQEYWTLYNYIDQYKAQRKEVANPKKEAIYYDIRNRELLKDKPNDNDKHTPQEVRELMELNKQWRELLDED